MEVRDRVLGVARIAHVSDDLSGDDPGPDGEAGREAEGVGRLPVVGAGRVVVLVEVVVPPPLAVANRDGQTTDADRLGLQTRDLAIDRRQDRLHLDPDDVGALVAAATAVAGIHPAVGVGDRAEHGEHDRSRRPGVRVSARTRVAPTSRPVPSWAPTR